MTQETKQALSMEGFAELANTLENHAKKWELVNGEIVEMPSNPFSSHIAMIIGAVILAYLKTQGIKGYVSGEAGGYIFEGNVFAPDVAYIDYLPTRKGFSNIPPRLVVEVLSEPSNPKEQSDLRRKLAYYLRAGVVVWVVDYDSRTVEVFAPNAVALIYEANDTLDGGEVLKGFALPVRDIFPEED